MIRSRNFIDDSSNAKRTLLSKPLSSFHDPLQRLVKRRNPGVKLPLSSNLKDKSIWSFQIPKGMIYWTAGVFLVLPLFLFFWKETHVATPKVVQTQEVKHTILNVRKHTKHAAWMEESFSDEKRNSTDTDITGSNENNRLGSPRNATKNIEAQEGAAKPVNSSLPSPGDDISGSGTGILPSVVGRKVEQLQDSTNSSFNSSPLITEQANG